MRDIALTDMERLGAFDEAERTFQMTEEAFRTFYELTARPVRVYLARMTGDDRLADDLLQEAYYRFLRANVSFENHDHRRNYLFRIATNLVHDHRRKPFMEVPATADLPEVAAPAQTAEQAARRLDLHRALARLKPRERSMLWLAYAQGWSHGEIAAAVGVKTASMKAMLARARHRLVTLLNPSAFAPTPLLELRRGRAVALRAKADKATADKGGRS